MGIQRLVPMDVVIEDFILSTGLDSHVYTPTLNRWIKKAYFYMNDITNALTSWIAIQTVENCAINIPKNATVIEWIAQGDIGCECTASLNTMNNSYPIGVYTLNTGTGDIVTLRGGFDFKVRNDQIVFTNTDANGSVFTINYGGYKTDCDGV